MNDLRRYLNIITESFDDLVLWINPTADDAEEIEGSYHHTEEIEQNPSRYDVDARLVDQEMAKPGYEYSRNEVLINAAMQQGWDRVTLRGDNAAIHTLDERRAQAALRFIEERYRPIADTIIEIGNRNFVLDDHATNILRKTGRILPATEV